MGCLHHAILGLYRDRSDLQWGGQPLPSMAPTARDGGRVPPRIGEKPCIMLATRRLLIISACAVAFMAVSGAHAADLSDLDGDTVEARYTALHTALRIWERCEGDLPGEMSQQIDAVIVSVAGGNLGAGRKLSALSSGQATAARLTSAGCGTAQVAPWLAAFQERLLPLLNQ